MQQLSNIDDNFEKTWSSYRPKAGYYALLNLIISLVATGILLIILGVLASLSIPTIMTLFEWMRDGKGEVVTPNTFHFVWIGIAFLIFIVSSSLLKSWQTAVIWIAFSSPTKIRISDVMKKSIALTPRYFGLGILQNIIVTTGFLLFIVPGIIFSGWFTFSGIVAQKNSIIDSLKISRALVTTRWWQIVLRLLLGLLLASFIPQIISSTVTSTLLSGPDGFDIIAILGILIAFGIAIFQAFFLMQWYNAYKYAVYLDVKESRESTPSESPVAPQAM